jgi:hypothetical protein
MLRPRNVRIVGGANGGKTKTQKLNFLFFQIFFAGLLTMTAADFKKKFAKVYFPQKCVDYVYY